MSKKEINQVYDYINQGERGSAKSYLQFKTLSMADKEKCNMLIDEWPEDVRLTLDKVDPKSEEENEGHESWKDFGDGTFEMIPEFPEQPKRDLVQDL